MSEPTSGGVVFHLNDSSPAAGEAAALSMEAAPKVVATNTAARMAKVIRLQ